MSCPTSRSWSSSPGRLPSRGPLQIRTRSFPPSGSSAGCASWTLPPTSTCPLPSRVLVTWFLQLMTLKPWFPPEDHSQHEPPSLHQVPELPGSPASPLLWGSPTPLFPSAIASVPLAQAYQAVTHFCSGWARVQRPAAGGFDIRPSSLPCRCPALEKQGPPRFPVRPNSRTPWSTTPPVQPHHFPPNAGGSLLLSSRSMTLGTSRTRRFSRPTSHGSLVRLPTHRR